MIINDKGTSFFRPSVAIACREIAKSIGDRDISVRMAALNCFVTAFPTLGDDLFKFISNVRIENTIYLTYFKLIKLLQLIYCNFIYYKKNLL